MIKFFIIGTALCASLLANAAAESNWRELWDRKSSDAWYARSEAELRAQASAGNANAMWVLAAKMYQNQRYDEFVEWRTRAAKAGSVQAITEQAIQLKQTNIVEAIKLLEQMSATGYPMAKIELAGSLLAGDKDKDFRFIKPDVGRAVELYQQAADERAINAWVQLSQLYACGIGEPRNNGELPAVLMLKAANAGNADAMTVMSRRFRLGFGVEQDLLAATTWAMRENFQYQRRIRPDHPPGLFDWITADPGPDDETLRNLSTLFEDALLKKSPQALEALAAKHIAGENGKPNLPRAAALLTLAERARSATAAAKRAEISPRFTDEDKQAYNRDLNWMTYVSENGN
jgi:TPR repeat protein